jgi:hypothetical protein
MNTDPLDPLVPRILTFIRDHPPGRDAPGDEARFNALALELFAAQCDAVPAYRALATHLGAAPDTVRHWREIPAVPTAAFKEFAFTSLPPERRTRVFQSSGTTTGHPGRVFHDAASLEVYAASVRAWFQPHLVPDADEAAGPGLRFVLLTPPVAQAPHSSLAEMAERVAERFGAGAAVAAGRVDSSGAWRLDLECLVPVLREVTASGQPVCLLGTAFSFVHLLDHLAETGLRLRLPPGSRVMETGGYKGRSRELPRNELHAGLTRWLGVPAPHIVGEYGMCELASQAYDRVVGETGPRLFRFPPWARAAVVSPETGREVADGEAGLLRVVDLANVRAVLAVLTEDLAVRRGAGFELLGRAAGAETRGCSLLAAA